MIKSDDACQTLTLHHIVYDMNSYTYHHHHHHSSTLYVW